MQSLPGEIIQLEHFPSSLFSPRALEKLARRKTDSENENILEHESEEEFIVAMLKKTDWNKAKAARLVAVNSEVDLENK